jgi:hypothetical protein
MNEEELEKLDRIIDEWVREGTPILMAAMTPLHREELRDKIVEFINEICIEIISYAHPVIREYNKQQQENK